MMKSNGNLYNQALERLERREKRLMKREPGLAGRTLRDTKQAIEQSIPAGLNETLNTAFLKALQLLLTKGTGLLEKTFSEQELAEQYSTCAAELNSPNAQKALRLSCRSAGLSSRFTATLAAAEGSLLGVLGIGLPDIPVLMGLMLRNIYQTAVRYGFSYRPPSEQSYILFLLCASLSEQEKRRAYSEQADRLARSLDHGWPVSIDLQAQMEDTACVLSSALLVAKFIQGLPVVGAVGGVANLTIGTKVTGFVRLKYQKRFLEKKRKEYIDTASQKPRES